VDFDIRKASSAFRGSTVGMLLKIFYPAGSFGSDTARAILRIPESSALKNLFQRHIGALNITLIQKMKKDQNL
jgi:hypothetical protein